jgi:hypothetical protein
MCGADLEAETPETDFISDAGIFQDLIYFFREEATPQVPNLASNHK